MATGDDKGELRPEPSSSAVQEPPPGQGSDDFEPTPQITLDRYLSRRRATPKMGWSQMISMLAMLVALLMIVFYREQCGGMVGKLMHEVAPGQQSAAPAAPPVRYQLDQ